MILSFALKFKYIVHTMSDEAIFFHESTSWPDNDEGPDMPVYEYQALDAQGKKRKGIVEADGLTQARSRLRASGLYPVSFKESRAKKSGGESWLSFSLFNNVSAEEIFVVTRQLATLLGAGIPVDAALSSLSEQTGNAAMKKVLGQIKTEVNEGKTLAQAMGSHGKVFSPIFVNMVRAGEESGSLGVVLDRLADFSEKQQDLRGKVKAALYYPIFMAVIGTAILAVLITYVVPNITQIFDEMDQVLPLPTLLLIRFSSLLQQYWWAMAILAVLLFFVARSLVASPSGRYYWDSIKLKIPLVGPVLHKIILARFASTMANLNRSGVEFMTSMRIVRTLVNNVRIAAVIDEATELIGKGKSMTVALAASEWFPPMFVQLIAAGEQSGKLDDMLDKAASAYERDVEAAVKGMTSLLEPLMITVMGLAVGSIVVSILLPIFEMNQMIR